jgi:Multicopper oxidase
VLAAPATAAAAWHYQTQTTTGVATSSRDIGKGCSAHRDSSTGLVIRCDMASASAVVRYTFTVSAKAGTIWYHPHTQPYYTYGRVTWTGEKLSRTRVRITARMNGASRIHIYSVFINYYR